MPFGVVDKISGPQNKLAFLFIVHLHSAFGYELHLEVVVVIVPAGGATQLYFTGYSGVVLTPSRLAQSQVTNLKPVPETGHGEKISIIGPGETKLGLSLG